MASPSQPRNPPRPAGTVSLLDPRSGAAEDWRSEEKSRSHHSRIHVAPPQERDCDLESGRRVCAQVCREQLQEFALAFVFLPPSHRRRAQCVVAYAHTLFDFARQQGIEGDRLTQINRWEFALESALAGEPPAQPIFVCIAAEEEQQPWPRQIFSTLGQAARHRIGQDRPVDPAQNEVRWAATASAVVHSVLGQEPSPSTVALGVALIQVWRLKNLGDELRYGRCDLAPAVLATLAPDDRSPSLEGVGRVVHEESKALRERVLQAKQNLSDLPAPYRRAARCLLFTALDLLKAMEKRGAGLLDDPPGLGLLSRIGVLMRARWGS